MGELVEKRNKLVAELRTKREALIKEMAPLREEIEVSRGKLKKFKDKKEALKGQGNYRKLRSKLASMMPKLASIDEEISATLSGTPGNKTLEAETGNFAPATTKN